jgi:Uma2 family endonuclease
VSIRPVIDATDGALQFIPMSYDEWRELPEKPKDEFIDGVGIVSPPPAYDHGEGQASLAFALRKALPTLRVVVEVEFLLIDRRRVRRPDISLVEQRPEGIWIADPPVLIAEVLSPGTRSQDTVNKASEYAEAGVGHYWLLDPASRSLEAYRNIGGGWELTGRADAADPLVDIEVAPWGSVPIDLTEIFRP